MIKDRTYDRTINGCIVAVVLSAFLFDRAEGFRWLAGAVGIVAAITSVTIYFFHKFNLGQQGHEDQNTKGENRQGDESLPVYELFSRYADDAFFKSIDQFRNMEIDYLFKLSSHEQNEKDRIDDITEVVNRLSSREGEWIYEFIFERNGDLVIRPIQQRHYPTETVFDLSTPGVSGESTKSRESNVH